MTKVSVPPSIGKRMPGEGATNTMAAKLRLDLQEKSVSVGWSSSLSVVPLWPMTVQSRPSLPPAGPRYKGRLKARLRLDIASRLVRQRACKIARIGQIKGFV